MTPSKEVENLLERMRDITKNPVAFDKLSDQLAVLCRAYMTPSPDTSWDQFAIKGNQARIIGILFERLGKCVTKAAMFDALYFDRTGDEPDAKIVDVIVCHIRAKLQAFNAEFWIETNWGEGYTLHKGAAPASVLAKRMDGKTLFWSPPAGTKYAKRRVKILSGQIAA